MRILVVDDHSATLELMRLTFASLGHSVTGVSTVVAALAVLDADGPDVILSDLTFPGFAGDGRDGYDLAREVRSRPEHLGVGLVAVTGAGSPSEHRAAIESGFDRVVVKPFDLASLIDQIGAFDRDR